MKENSDYIKNIKVITISTFKGGEKMRSIIYLLLNYINTAFRDDTNYHIAKTILLNLKAVKDLSLEDCAVLCDCSSSTINRFCKKIGFVNYSSFRNILQVQSDSLLPMVQDDTELLAKNLVLVENTNRHLISQLNKRISQSNRVIILGYGEFQYTALYYQKQMFTLNKLVEVANVYIDNYDFKALTKDDLVIVVSMNGEFIKPNKAYFKSAKCHKAIITMDESEELNELIEISIHLPSTNLSYSKYLLLRIYEIMLEDYRTMVS